MKTLSLATAGRTSKARRAQERRRRPGGPASTGPDLSQVSARKNLNETRSSSRTSSPTTTARCAWSSPCPRRSRSGSSWASPTTRSCAAASSQDEVVTAKDLMVQPNPPRFLREGDVLEFTVKVTQPVATPADAARCGSRCADARTEQAGRRRARQLAPPTRRSTCRPSESRSFSWRLTVPDGLGPITYKAVGATEQALATARKAMLPVLSKRVLVHRVAAAADPRARRRRRSTSRSSASPASRTRSSTRR